MEFYIYSVYINKDNCKSIEVTLLYWKILTISSKSRDTIPQTIFNFVNQVYFALN